MCFDKNANKCGLCWKTVNDFWISTKMFGFLPWILFGGDDDDASLQYRIQFPQQYLLFAHLFQIEKLINIYETFELIWKEEKTYR